MCGNNWNKSCEILVFFEDLVPDMDMSIAGWLAKNMLSHKKPKKLNNIDNLTN